MDAITDQTSFLAPGLDTDPQKALDPAAASDHDSLRTTGFSMALVFIFLRVTGLHEILTEKLGMNLFVLYWFAIPSLSCLFFSGGLSRLWRERTVRLWIWFAVWLLLAVPSSDWPGGSAQVAIGFIRTELPVLFLVAGFAVTWKDCRRLLGVLIASAFTNVLIGFLFPGEAGATGRLEVGANITMSNANDFAALLVFLLPFLILCILTPGRSMIGRCLALPCLGYGIYLMLSTGSRGALVGLFAALLFALMKLPVAQRLLIVACTIAIACLMLVALPNYTLFRLESTISAGHVWNTSEDVGYSSASDPSMQDESAEARWYLLKSSLLFTAQHPVFGVGPGQFATHEGFSARANGLHGNWHETHNSYTQASSEAGIPALVFLMAALIITYRSLGKTYDQSRNIASMDHAREMRLASFFVMVSFIAFCATAFFLSLVYTFYLPLLSGLAIALRRASQADLALLDPMNA